jgi:hypothetical protein
VIDGYKRIAALEQLGRDTVEATLWPMSEAEALPLSRSLQFSPRESALEQGWLLARMEESFGYGLDELARRFDRSVSWCRGAYRQYTAAPIDTDAVFLPSSLPTFPGTRLGIDVFTRSNVAAFNRYFEPGLGSLLTRPDAPTHIFGGLSASWKDGRFRIALGLNF